VNTAHAEGSRRALATAAASWEIARMALHLESVRLGVDDLAEASAAYRLLLGVEPLETAEGLHRFQLAPGAIEIEGGRPGLRALRFLVEDEAEPHGPFDGLDVRFAVAAPPSPPSHLPAVQAIDHVVVQTPDADRAIALWRDRLGLRLALDRPFPERGLRLVFFRSGGITLEYATRHPPPEERAGPDRLHGVSYRVADLEAHRARLLAAGVDVSAIRPGMRPGTVVASVRSGTAGVPTLILGTPREA
jgi:catechol 2,3-dioxygenase-like lactoylglutathione lyase family enzyme